MGVNVALDYLYDYLTNRGMVVGDTRLVLVTPTKVDKAKLRAALQTSLHPYLRPGEDDLIYDRIHVTTPRIEGRA